MSTKALLFIILIFTINPIRGQNTADSLMLKANDLLNIKEDPHSALIVYQKITKDYRQSPSYPEALYIVGSLSLELGKYDSAEKVLKKILNSNLVEKHNKRYKDEIYELDNNIKHRVCFMLYELNFTTKHYFRSLKYLKLSEKKYPLIHFCGNCHASSDLYTTAQYSKVYVELNQIDKAIDLLCPHLFNSPFSNNNIVVDQLKIVLLRKFTQEQINQEIRNAENTIELNKLGYNCLITLFGRRIELSDLDYEATLRNEKDRYDYWLMDRIDQHKLAYRNSYLYKHFIE